ncbi:MarC family protein [Psychromonas sp. 14N.309.X.WAT.B.A12]|uniref:MarC family protein n=1 Tax=unclassified Psychromonas TaxID=2614957 RepID=UPI0025B197EF|nr:MarC family protein [Psychromonas sp. 14N.309.X.WAT.B.A12]MDN2661954.1 MarC family protein [Psychromonas sp. 14N.309.X.WAT.B.A12]
MDFALYLHAITGLLVIIDPIGSALIFNSLTSGSDQRHRNLMAIKSIIISGLTLVLFGNYGEALFSQLGININSLRISGGLLLFYTAFMMITQELKFSNSGKNADISVFPMSIPLLAGPGTLTLAILLYSQPPETGSTMLSVTAAIISVLLITMVGMVGSKYLKKIIGKTGDEILRRFLGVILAALAIQFIYEGVRNISM